MFMFGCGFSHLLTQPFLIATTYITQYLVFFQCDDLELTQICTLSFYYLVGGLEHVLFSHILGISSSQLTNSYFFRGVG